MKKIQDLFRRHFKKHSTDKDLPEYNREVRDAIRKKNEAMYLLYDIFRYSQMNR